MALNIVTLAEYKTYAMINSTNQDPEIKLIMPGITAFIRTYCNRTFVDYFSDTKTEVFSGGYSSYITKEYPLISISSLEYSSDNGATYTTLTEYVDYVYDGELERVVPTNGSVFPKLVNGYKITYNAGFEVYPVEIKLAAMDLITYYLKSDSSVKSSRSAGSNTSQIEYVLNAGLPSNIRRILDQYRSVN